MADEQDKESKTEEPTQRRLDEALKRGQVIASREVSSFFLLCCFAFILLALLPNSMDDLRRVMFPFVAQPEDYELDFNNFRHVMRDVSLQVIGLMVLPITLALVAVFIPNILKGKWVFSLDPLAPKLDKISPLKGWQRLFSMKSFVEFFKGMLKIAAVGVVGVIAVYAYKEEVRQLLDKEAVEMLAYLLTLAKRILIGVLCLMFLIAIADYLYQRFEYMKNLRMTKQELKDEYKQQEGDPQIKQRLRAIRVERARKRMMANVPTADVVITNPTHFAVALKYDSLTMPAPVVVAKGVDEVAFRIRELAEKNKITIVRNPPLARVLYDTTDVDELIPYEYFKAVAEVIGYVYKLRGHKLPPKKDTGGKKAGTPIKGKPPAKSKGKPAPKKGASGNTRKKKK